LASNGSWEEALMSTFPWLEVGEKLRPYVASGPIAGLDYGALLENEPELAERLGPIEHEDPHATAPIWAGLWAQSGFPQIVASQKLLASLGATSIAPECAGNVVWPWQAFLVVVPPGMLKGEMLYGSTLEMRDMVRIACMRLNDVGDVRFLFWAADWASSWVSDCMSIASSIQGDVVGTGLMLKGGADDLADVDQRSMRIGIRMTLGLCLELSSPEHAKPIAEHARSISKRHGPPKVWTFNVRRDVRLDVRQAVADYIGGVGVSTRAAYKTKTL
jgi:hypothetical protein